MADRNTWFGWILLIATFTIFSSVNAQPTANSVSLDYYLPGEVSYDSEIPTPESVIGHPVGAWHVRHAQMAEYMRELAASSERVSVREIGRTHEQRPLIVLTVTSPSNHGRLDKIRERRSQWMDPQSSIDMDVSSLPVVAYMGYSIHGDEPSGTNAVMVAAYHLAAAQGDQVEQMLDNTVILLDPSLNPDGYSRFAQWANSNRDRQLVADPQSREQNQPWPGGRTNHYWFDLNRDWMLVQHPSSRARIKLFHRWKPNVVTDFHEMGSNSTYFFQPGVPSRTNPLTPERNQQLTQVIAEYHADRLDREEVLYYTKERFDDFYSGKGSTYPDANGSIGILFEQATSDGHRKETVHGTLNFPFTVKNQFLTTLSTLEGVTSLREELLKYQKTFFRDTRESARQDDIRAYVFGTPADPARSYQLASLIDRHDIDIYRLDEDLSVEEQQFEAESSYLVPIRQQQYKMIKVLFNRQTTFQDSIFYDVSTWTMPLAFNVPYKSLNAGRYSEELKGEEFSADGLPSGKLVGGSADYAYLFEWDGFYAPRALHRFQEAGVRAKVATKPFEAVTSEGTNEFDYGTVLVPFYLQDTSKEKIHQIAREVARNDAINIYAVSTGLTPRGIDLGSGSFEPLTRPRTLLVTGSGVRSYEAGQVWHLLDQRYEMPVSRVSTRRLGSINWERYNTAVMVDGNYRDVTDEATGKLKNWVQSGGTLITLKDATRWAARQDLAPFRFPGEEDTADSAAKAGKPYALKDRIQDAQQIGGSIFDARLDTTHPMGYGYNSATIPVFRDHTMFMKPSKSPYDTPLRYTEDPLASGYVSDENLQKLKGTAGIVVAERGGGQIIGFADNPNFRAFWYGTNKLFANALFFGEIIDAERGGY